MSIISMSSKMAEVDQGPLKSRVSTVKTYIVDADT